MWYSASQPGIFRLVLMSFIFVISRLCWNCAQIFWTCIGTVVISVFIGLKFCDVILNGSPSISCYKKQQRKNSPLFMCWFVLMNENCWLVVVIPKGSKMYLLRWCKNCLALGDHRVYFLSANFTRRWCWNKYNCFRCNLHWVCFMCSVNIVSQW